MSGLVALIILLLLAGVLIGFHDQIDAWLGRFGDGWPIRRREKQ